MKKENNSNPFVYIRGVANRGKEVIAELEKRGGCNKYGFIGECEYHIFFISEKGIINGVADNDDDTKWLKEHYEEITLPIQKYQPQDKELVWCWNWKCVRDLRFYDAENKATFTSVGKRNGLKYKHYAPYEGGNSDWAKEALKKLED